MTFEEYQVGGRALYAGFVEAVRQILAAAVKANAMTPHAITGRAKDSASLKKKLEKNGIPLDAAIDEQLRDLAGVRLVFLTNTQVERFLASGIIHENFDVSNVNVHHPVPGTQTETRLFDSTNYTAQLKPERTALAEYHPFAGLKVEIQVQTLLKHAWAEMGHDTIYKEPDLQHVDKQQLERIKERMDAVMREHLLPAGHDFDMIARDFALLIQADQNFAPCIEAISTSKSNNALSAALDTLSDVVLPRLENRGDRFLEQLPALIDVVERTRRSPAEPIVDPSGAFDGENGLDVARKVAPVIEHHLLYDPTRTLDALIRLFTQSEGEERRLWLDLGRRLAENDVATWRTHGPAVQRIILDVFAALDTDALTAARELVVTMMQQVLSSEVNGISRGDFHTFQIAKGSVNASDAVRQVRSDAIGLLENLLAVSAEDQERGEILPALREASRPPYHGGSDAVRVLVMNDAARVAAIQRGLAPQCGLEMRRQMEVDAIHVHSWYHVLPEDMAANAELVGAQTAIMGELLALRDTLNADPDFILYKTLIGHDSVHPDAWDAEHFDPERLQKWREDSFPAIVGQIDTDGAEAWTSLVRRYLAEPIGIGDWLPLSGFSRHVAETRPDTAVHLLYQMDDALRLILTALLHGLEAAGRLDVIDPAVARFSGQGRYFQEMAAWLGERDGDGSKRLLSLSARARELGEHDGVLALVNAAGQAFKKTGDPSLIADVLMPAVALFTDAHLPGWVVNAWWVSHGGMVATLDEAQTTAFLASFVELPKIDHNAEYALARAADHFPARVLEFFESRIGRGRGDGGYFDAVPFRLHELPRPLSPHPEMLLRSARRMYGLKPSLHRFLGGKLVANIFPQLIPEIAGPLGGFVANGDREDLSFVLSTLQPYEGAEEVYAVCMDVVDRLDPGDDMLGRVTAVLGETGVVTGQFGRVEAEVEQHGRLQAWINDPREKVAAFARTEARSTAQSMAWEQRIAERELEQMKREWGEPETKH